LAYESGNFASWPDVAYRPDVAWSTLPRLRRATSVVNAWVAIAPGLQYVLDNPWCFSLAHVVSVQNDEVFATNLKADGIVPGAANGRTLPTLLASQGVRLVPCAGTHGKNVELKSKIKWVASR
jgi:hypothetical protein